MSDDLPKLSATQAAAAIERGELGADELFAFYRKRAQADASANGDGLNRFTWVAEDASTTPLQSGPGWSDSAGTPGAGSLAGVPLAVKDLFCTKGVPSQSGSRILEGYRPPYTASAVQAPTGVGATLLAKTNQDEFAMGSSTENSASGPTLNRWDRSRVPGGSSGGSAAAVAAGLAPWAIGTDTGGSIRQPAALCGIVGLKPTYGAVSRFGMIAFASSLDQAGPLTRDVTDAALMLRHMVGRDRCDATSLDYPHEIELPRAERLAGLRLGVPVELRAPDPDAAGGEAEAGAEIEPGVRESFERALQALGFEEGAARV
ncbi:MAG TPA: amidase [Solirubrobacteraceae bacterium]|nr:amidase [Solirubrobacteraceae bacterium]